MRSEKKIQQALELLEEASREKHVELQKVISDLYAKVQEAEHVAKDTVKSAAIGIDKSVHEKPWHYIISAALGGLVIGLFCRSRH